MKKSFIIGVGAVLCALSLGLCGYSGIKILKHKNIEKKLTAYGSEHFGYEESQKGYGFGDRYFYDDFQPENPLQEKIIKAFSDEYLYFDSLDKIVVKDKKIDIEINLKGHFENQFSKIKNEYKYDEDGFIVRKYSEPLESELLHVADCSEKIMKKLVEEDNLLKGYTYSITVQKADESDATALNKEHSFRSDLWSVQNRITAEEDTLLKKYLFLFLIVAFTFAGAITGNKILCLIFTVIAFVLSFKLNSGLGLLFAGGALCILQMKNSEGVNMKILLSIFGLIFIIAGGYFTVRYVRPYYYCKYDLVMNIYMTFIMVANYFCVFSQDLYKVFMNCKNDK